MALNPTEQKIAKALGFSEKQYETSREHRLAWHTQCADKGKSGASIESEICDNLGISTASYRDRIALNARGGPPVVVSRTELGADEYDGSTVLASDSASKRRFSSATHEPTSDAVAVPLSPRVTGQFTPAGATDEERKIMRTLGIGAGYSYPPGGNRNDKTGYSGWSPDRDTFRRPGLHTKSNGEADNARKSFHFSGIRRVNA